HELRFFFSSRRRHTRCLSDWSSDVCSSDLNVSGKRVVRQSPGEGTNKFESCGEVVKVFPEYSWSSCQLEVPLADHQIPIASETRSEERRVGKECRSSYSRTHQ